MGQREQFALVRLLLSEIVLQPSGSRASGVENLSGTRYQPSASLCARVIFPRSVPARHRSTACSWPRCHSPVPLRAAGPPHGARSLLGASSSYLQGLKCETCGHRFWSAPKSRGIWLPPLLGTEPQPRFVNISVRGGCAEGLGTRAVARQSTVAVN